HGLLGILLHRARMVTLAPRWMPALADGRTLLPMQRSYIRTNTGWKTRESFASDPSRPRRKGLVGQLVTASDAEAQWARVGVLMHDSFEPHKTTWWRFFPDVPEAESETYGYPQPLSADFWRL